MTARIHRRACEISVWIPARVYAARMPCATCTFTFLCVVVPREWMETRSSCALPFKVFFCFAEVSDYITIATCQNQISAIPFDYRYIENIFWYNFDRPNDSTKQFRFVIEISLLIVRITAPVVKNPCNPSPCGPNSQCRQNNMQAVCSCISGFVGAPPTCRPECVISSDCPKNEACTNQKCRDPCPGSCGRNTICNVINHNPVCSCRPGMTGDPFINCFPLRKTPPMEILSSIKFSKSRFPRFA